MGTSTLIQIGVYDITAKADLAALSTNKQAFVDMSQLKQDVITIQKYATLETDRFLLDGSFNPFPDDPQNKQMGFWSNTQSNSGGTFAVNPKIQFQFSQNHSSIGLTLDTSSNNDSDYTVNIKWYNSSNTVIKDSNYTCAAGIHVIEEKVDNYRRIDIEFLSTAKPNRWIKLDLIVFGIMLTYQGNNITSAKLIEEVDPISADLTINELDFKLYSPEKDFSLANPKGIYTALQQSQPITVTGFIDGQTVPMGVYYLDTWKMDSETNSTFEAIDVIGVLDKSTFKNGKVYQNATAQSILEDIKTSSGITNMSIQTEYQNTLINGWLPICTHREAIQQLALALGLAVESTRQNQVRLFKINPTPTHTITNDQRHIAGTAEQLPLVTDIEITSHNYEINPQSEELYKATLTPGNYEITFSEPTTAHTISGGTITLAKTNYVIINVATAQEVTVSAKKYKDNNITTFKQMQELPAGATRNAKKITNATLVDKTRAAAIIDDIYNHYQSRRLDKFNFRIDTHQAGESARVQSIGETYLTGTITKLEIDMSKGYVARTEILGNNEVI